MHNEKGLLGIKFILILLVLLAGVIWAYRKGYIKWAGPKPMGVAEEMKDDAAHSIKKMAK